MKQNGETGDGGGGGRRRQPAEGHVVVFLTAFHIEPRQPQRGAHGKRGGDDPHRLVVQIGELGTEFNQQKRRRDAKRDAVAQAVQLGAKVAGSLRQPRHMPVERMERAERQENPSPMA